ncbi:MAG: hypothetical protein QM723_40590 [Myxococcaceae bacterium]
MNSDQINPNSHSTRSTQNRTQPYSPTQGPKWALEQLNAAADALEAFKQLRPEYATQTPSLTLVVLTAQLMQGNALRSVEGALVDIAKAIDAAR